jgi:hypothetical protein
MVNMKSGFLAGLGQTAVFATISGPLNDLAPQTGGDGH